MEKITRVDFKPLHIADNSTDDTFIMQIWYDTYIEGQQLVGASTITRKQYEFIQYHLQNIIS